MIKAKEKKKILTISCSDSNFSLNIYYPFSIYTYVCIFLVIFSVTSFSISVFYLSVSENIDLFLLFLASFDEN